MNSHDQSQEDHYLQTVLRMAERLILPEQGLEGHYPHFDRIQGYHRQATASLADQHIKDGRISRQEAMDLAMASMLTSGRSKRLLGVPAMPLVITAQTSRHLQAAAEALEIRLIVFNPAGESPRGRNDNPPRDARQRPNSHKGAGMNAEFIIIEDPQETAVMEYLDTLNRGRFDPDQGHRTRPGQSPANSVKDILRHRLPVEAVCVASDDTGIVMTVRRPEGAIASWNHRELEAFEGIAMGGHPQDGLYQEAYARLFHDVPRNPIPDQIPLYRPGYSYEAPDGVPLHGPIYKEPRPVADGWAMTLWHANHRLQNARSLRIVVRRYEDTLDPDICNYYNHRAFLRLAEPGE